MSKEDQSLKEAIQLQQKDNARHKWRRIALPVARVLAGTIFGSTAILHAMGVSGGVYYAPEQGYAMYQINQGNIHCITGQVPDAEAWYVRGEKLTRIIDTCTRFRAIYDKPPIIWGSGGHP
jgi:hypothetical protein